ncbi:hypothetical protein N7539_006529 [Penicillium diatomitis]|uniref:Uncharacterized protein n=1 Tax=Penicillium diatomitis TaxID=2819901 RepID=A0A9X0BSY2_9EURO|nr:uncharacterized protein N7539_006529 [Penicillium diatomitis]KAJ5483083.1 hypothetical protein N7539_006529 [Penicillium diatomitis]
MLKDTTVEALEDDLAGYSQDHCKISYVQVLKVFLEVDHSDEVLNICALEILWSNIEHAVPMKL